MLFLRTRPVSNRSELMIALQDAIRLEHSTIPPYLTAYYTLKGTSESVQYARSIMRDIILEEMLHMTHAANILLAIGGSPQFAFADFIPKYPGPLPLGIGDDDGAAPELALQVGLKRYSRETVKDVFMAIEEPENPIVIRDRTVAAELAAPPRFQTIGQFYQSIRERIRLEGEDLFRKTDPGLQVLDWFEKDEEIKITDVASAERAIEIIIEQGEGTPQRPVDLLGDIPHFYRFSELNHGKKLVLDPNSEVGVSFDPGQPIAIDDRLDVIQMVDNPGTVDLPDQLIFLQRLSDEFDMVYSNLLRGLQGAFNGAPDTMQNAIGAMFELKTVAEELLRQELSEEQVAGPRFRFVPL